MTPKLKIIMGPMFSGKSTELIRLIRREKVITDNILVIKPIIDNRYSSDHICSHDYDKVKCITTENLNSVKNLSEWEKAEVIFIDEAQFFTGLYNFVLENLEQFNKSIIVVGLDGDYKRKPFGEILQLIPIADNVTKLTSYCNFCKDGTNGIFTLRLNNSQNQELVGGSEIYKSVCRNHYNLLKQITTNNIIV